MRGHFVERRWVHDPAVYAPPRYRRGCAYSAFVPTPLTDLAAVQPAVAGAISVAEDAIRGLNAVAEPALAPLARLLLRTESIASSKVEGMQVDARLLARAEARFDMGRAIGPEAAEVIANIDAMQVAVNRATEADVVTVDHIVETHRALLARSANTAKIAGVIRSEQNWIGGNDYNPCGAAFVPPPPEHLAPLLEDLVGFCNTDHLPPLMQAGLAHAQFETIHPFADGNGRTGRALIQVVLRRRGLAPAYVPPLSIVLAADKDDYIAGLTDFRLGLENAWLQRFANATARAAELATRYLGDIRCLQESWRRLLAARKLRSDAVAWRVIDVLPAHPIISQPVAVAATGGSRPAVQGAIDLLVDVGVLRPVSTGRRNRSWEAAGLIDLSVELEALNPR